MANKLPPLGASATHLPSSMLGLAAAFATIGILRAYAADMDPLFASILVMAAAAVPAVLADMVFLKRYRAPEAGLSSKRPLRARRLLHKCLGLLVTFASFALLYAMLPEYDSEFYNRYFMLVGLALPVLVLVTPFYFAWCLMHEAHPHDDGYDELAKLCLGQWQNRNWSEIGRHYRNWLVKAFFLPLMLTYIIGSIQGLITMDVDFTHFRPIYTTFYSLIMFTDLLFASIGYVLTLRVLNAHIRSSEPTFRGWAVAVACYAPFWEGLLYGRFFDYGDPIDWWSWLAPYPVITIAWGIAILSLLFIYSLATVCLGIRFSNLTYRGLITSGPYRYTKHPAYVAKNLSWWLVSVPFITNGGITTAITHCVLLLGVNFIYYQRAVTEENHLSNYPEYRAYALAMNQRSIFRPLVKYLPFLEYKVPQHLPRI